jgi:hypothetical protein
LSTQRRELVARVANPTREPRNTGRLRFVFDGEVHFAMELRSPSNDSREIEQQ